MNDKLTPENTRVTIEEIRVRQGETDWEALRAMTEEEVLEAAKSDPDAQPTELKYWDDAELVPPVA